MAALKRIIDPELRRSIVDLGIESHFASGNKPAKRVLMATGSTPYSETALRFGIYVMRANEIVINT